MFLNCKCRRHPQLVVHLVQSDLHLHAARIQMIRVPGQTFNRKPPVSTSLVFYYSYIAWIREMFASCNYYDTHPGNNIELFLRLWAALIKKFCCLCKVSDHDAQLRCSVRRYRGGRWVSVAILRNSDTIQQAYSRNRHKVTGFRVSHAMTQMGHTVMDKLIWCLQNFDFYQLGNKCKYTNPQLCWSCYSLILLSVSTGSVCTF